MFLLVTRKLRIASAESLGNLTALALVAKGFTSLSSRVLHTD
jgi:hypothetical protein